MLTADRIGRGLRSWGKEKYLFRAPPSEKRRTIDREIFSNIYFIVALTLVVGSQSQ